MEGRGSKKGQKRGQKRGGGGTSPKVKNRVCIKMRVWSVVNACLDMGVFFDVKSGVSFVLPRIIAKKRAKKSEKCRFSIRTFDV